jgi:hypothetical protein
MIPDSNNSCLQMPTSQFESTDFSSNKLSMVLLGDEDRRMTTSEKFLKTDGNFLGLVINEVGN